MIPKVFGCVSMRDKIDKLAAPTHPRAEIVETHQSPLVSVLKGPGWESFNMSLNPIQEVAGFMGNVVIILTFLLRYKRDVVQRIISLSQRPRCCVLKPMGQLHYINTTSLLRPPRYCAVSP